MTVLEDFAKAVGFNLRAELDRSYAALQDLFDRDTRFFAWLRESALKRQPSATLTLDAYVAEKVRQINAECSRQLAAR